MKNRKHYYENEVNPTNTFKVPNTAIEVRGRFTESQINYIKFKWFWIGTATGGTLIAIIFYLQEINAI
jgi:cysteine synthase